MKNSKKKNPETIRRNRQLLINALSTCVIVIILFTIFDFAEDIMTDASAYELRYEESETYPQEGKQYTMYVDGRFYGRVDQNKFCLQDEAGNTDYRYCVLMEDAVEHKVVDVGLGEEFFLETQTVALDFLARHAERG